MIRKHENSDSWKAGIYAVAVHLALLTGMLISFNWKAAHPILNVTEVELWDKLPAAKPVIQEEPKPEPKPEIKEEPKPEPKPIVEEKPKPEEPKVDIELEKKKKELEQKEKLLEEKRRKDEALEKLKLEARQDELREKKAAEKKKNDDALRKLKEDMLNESGAEDTKESNADKANAIGKYTEMIKDKIRGNVTAGLCGGGNPVLKVSIGILPTGELSGAPKLTKLSGNSACDDAVERAILLSEPFKLPDDAKLKAEFRNIDLTFYPNK